jgi:hypothetical protein
MFDAVWVGDWKLVFFCEFNLPPNVILSKRKGCQQQNKDKNIWKQRHVDVVWAIVLCVKCQKLVIVVEIQNINHIFILQQNI